VAGSGVAVAAAVTAAGGEAAVEGEGQQEVGGSIWGNTGARPRRQKASFVGVGAAPAKNCVREWHHDPDDECEHTTAP